MSYWIYLLPSVSIFAWSLHEWARMRREQYVEEQRFLRAADAGFDEHHRCPQKTSRIESTGATGPVVLFRN